MDLKPSLSCSLFIKSVWALLGLTKQARVLVDRSWFQGFGFYLFFNKIVGCVGFTLIYYYQGDSLLSKNVLCDADFNEYVGYIFNLIYYAQGMTVHEIWVTRIVVNVVTTLRSLLFNWICKFQASELAGLLVLILLIVFVKTLPE